MNNKTRKKTKVQQKKRRIICNPPKCQCHKSCKNPPLPMSQTPFCIAHQNCINFSPLSGSEPDYQPDAWNSQEDLRKSHNCFIYAFNIWDKKRKSQCKSGNCYFHQPGYAAGYPSFSVNKYKSCADMMARLMGDNKSIKKVNFAYKCPPGFSKIAVIVDPYADFHFLRQDSNGYWSHKPGATNVTNKDSDDRLIFNPELANFCYPESSSRLNYTNFCTFYSVPRNRPVFIKG